MYPLKFAYKLTALAVLCAAATLSAHAAALALNTDFGNGSPTYPTPAGSIVGAPDTFSVTGGEVFYLGGIANDPGNPCFLAGSSSATCLQLPTSQGITAQLTSARLFGPGFYTVEIQMAGGPTNARVLAELGSPEMITVIANSQFTSYQFSRSVAQGVQTHLTITGNNEFLINSVRVGLLTGSPAPVPEPATWATLAGGLGLCGVGMLRRRKYEKRQR